MSATANIQNQPEHAQLNAPRYESRKAMLIAGLRRRYTSETMNTMGCQWQDFAAHIGRIPGQLRHEGYGLSFFGQGVPAVEYLTGVEVAGCSGLPAEFDCVSVPAQKYAVFTHASHVSGVHETCGAIEQWLPGSGLTPVAAVAGAPNFFELYTKDFNPQTGLGGIEIWVPIE